MLSDHEPVVGWEEVLKEQRTVRPEGGAPGLQTTKTEDLLKREDESAAGKRRGGGA